MKLTEARLKLLRGLRDHGGVFDRYLRVIAQGEIVAGSSSPTVIGAFRDDQIAMSARRIIITPAGRADLEAEDV